MNGYRVAAALVCVLGSTASGQLSCPPGTTAHYLIIAQSPSWAINEGYCVGPNDVAHGPTLAWIADGNQTVPLWSGSYASGYKQGVWREYRANQPTAVGSYERGLRQGFWVRNGPESFRNGEPFGDVVQKTSPTTSFHTTWRDSLLRQAEFETQTGRLLHLYERIARAHELRIDNRVGNHLIAQRVGVGYHGFVTVWRDQRLFFEGTFRDGAPWGILRWYRPDGTLQRADSIVGGNGMVRLRDLPSEMGLIPSLGLFGTRTMNTPAWGTLFERMRTPSGYVTQFFVEGELRNGKPTGSWTGPVSADRRCTAQFEDGLVHGQLRCWYRDTLTREEHFQRGELHGRARAWTRRGRLLFDGTFANNRLVGPVRIFNDSGSLILQSDTALNGFVSVPRGTSQYRYQFRSGDLIRYETLNPNGDQSAEDFDDAGNLVRLRWVTSDGTREESYRDGIAITRVETKRELGGWINRMEQKRDTTDTTRWSPDASQSKRVRLIRGDAPHVRVRGIAAPSAQPSPFPTPAPGPPQDFLPHVPGQPVTLTFIRGAAEFDAAILGWNWQTFRHDSLAVPALATAQQCASAAATLAGNMGIGVTRSDSVITIANGDMADIASRGGCPVRRR